MLLSRPDQQIRLRVVAINPVGQVKGQEGNQFLIKAAVDQSAEAWWRPGMTGVAKLDAGPPAGVLDPHAPLRGLHPPEVPVLSARATS